MPAPQCRFIGASLLVTTLRYGLEGLVARRGRSDRPDGRAVPGVHEPPAPLPWARDRGWLSQPSHVLPNQSQDLVGPRPVARSSMSRAWRIAVLLELLHHLFTAFGFRWRCG